MLTTNLQQNPEESASKQLLSVKNHNIAEKQRRIESIIQEIYEHDSVEQTASSSKKDAIQRLAKEMEEIMIQEGQSQEINQICTLICNRFEKDRKSGLKRWTIEVLDEKYKRKLDKSSIQSTHSFADLPVECSVTEELVLSELVKIRDKLDFFQLTKNATQKVAEVIYDIKQHAEDHARENSFELYNRHHTKSDLDFINDGADDVFDEKISKPPAPIPHDEAVRLVDAEAYEVSIRVADKLKEWADKQKNRYPSQVLDQAITWRDSMLALERILDQYLDDKARRTIKQWGKINATMAEHGGTAASSKSSMPVFDPTADTVKQLIDPKTLRPAYRDITKEQIDARGPKYASEIDFIIRQFILTDMMEERYMQIEIGYGEWRAWAAREKLSRKA